MNATTRDLNQGTTEAPDHGSGHRSAGDALAVDLIYGIGAWDRAAALINELAPVTRRDDWWSTGGPYDIIAKHLGSNK